MSNILPRPKAPCKRRRPEKKDRPAKVRWRVKGSGEEGHVYQGQVIVQRCSGCGQR